MPWWNKKKKEEFKSHAHRGSDDFEEIEIAESPNTAERRREIRELEKELYPLMEEQNRLSPGSAMYREHQKRIDLLSDTIIRLRAEQNREDDRHGIPRTMTARPRARSPQRRYYDISVSSRPRLSSRKPKRKLPPRDPVTGRFLPRR